ncbi:MMPL family transporter [Paenibacillus donghaensis]|uniref:MMPL family transporter n=1 Tax=Paenibacillus donghaensis TaxID=414771 RepID=UPI0018831815|nr:MMPL family transporter [Paenibacillus donghaensis]MBE9913575.1 MMPL family transporter [Paenibacillus donghaensis]
MGKMEIHFIKRFPGMILLCWTAFFVVFGSLSVQLPSAVQGPGLYTHGASHEVQKILEERLGIPPEPIIILFDKQAEVKQTMFERVIGNTLHSIGRLNGMTFLMSPLDNPELMNDDAAYALIGFGNSPEQQQAISKQIRRLLPESEGISVQLTGKTIIQEDVNKSSMHDFMVAERIGIPAAFIILLLAFGGILYALIPVLMGLLTVSAAMGLTVVISRIWGLELSNFILNVIPMTGLALSLDFAFIITSRFREEMGKGANPEEALRATLSTAGRAVYFSAVCVACGLIGVSFIPMPMFESAALCSLIVVILAAAINLSLVPALLVLMSPLIRRSRSSVKGPWPSYKLWLFWADRVMRRPLQVMGAAGLMLLVLLLPAFGLVTEVPGASSLPAAAESRQAEETIQARFQMEGKSEVLAVLLAAGNSFTQTELQAASDWFKEVNHDVSVISVKPLSGLRSGQSNESALGDLAVFRITLTGKPGSAEVHQWLRDAEQKAARSGVRILLGGEAKSMQEVKDAVAHSLPNMLGFIAISNLLVLLIAFRSFLIPLKAFMMNMLSILASFGVLVLVFQTGSTGLPPEKIAIMVPVFVFGLVFGVSMDYGVFLLSRMSEAFEETGDADEAIRRGMAATGKLITSAAAILVAVTLPFAFGQVVGVRQLGVGIASAVLIDVTLIRLLLVPSLMKLLGHLNWWMPRWLLLLLPNQRRH